MKLEGKIALVTGAARGIGRGIAEVFAEQGADVPSTISILPGCRRRTGELDPLPGSPVDRGAGGRFGPGRGGIDVQKVWNELGHIDILVNNAGIETIVPFLEITTSSGPGHRVDLRAPWLCSQVFAAG